MKPVRAKSAEMTKTLDRNRPFAEVHGVSDVRYEQDNLPFDYAGNLMVPASEPVEPVKKPGRPKKVVVQDTTE